MEARLTEINENEVLLYLGYKGGEVSARVQEQLRECRELLLKTAKPRITWRVFSLLPDGSLAGTDFRPEGRDVRALLKDCSRVIMMAATLGLEAEALLRRKQVEDMSTAVILDCCGSSAVENVCDNLCEDLADMLQAEGKYLTDRFSPGYGDLPFSQQPDFVRVLDLPRRIGVSLTPGGLMIPQKSVTALMGIADTPQKKRFRGCHRCSRFSNCDYRKEGKTCGNF